MPANMTVVDTLSAQIEQLNIDIINTELMIEDRERDLAMLRNRHGLLVASRDAHGELLDHATGTAPARFESHDVDVAPAHGIERPVDAHQGYDVQSWNSETVAIRLWISQSGGGRFDGMDAEELEVNVLDEIEFHVVPHRVNWLELARYFGGET